MANSQLSILFTTPSPAQYVELTKFDLVTNLYGTPSTRLPSAVSDSGGSAISGIALSGKAISGTDGQPLSQFTYGVLHCVLSDGTLVVIYRQGLADGSAAVTQNLYLATYTNAGGWANVDTVIAVAGFVSPVADRIILLSMFADTNDRVHIVYQYQQVGISTFTTVYTNWTKAGGFGASFTLALDISSVNPAWTRGLYLAGSDTICFLFERSTDHNVYEYTGTPSSLPVFSRAIVATAADQPDAARPFPMGMLLDQSGHRYGVWWASGTQNTIAYRINSGGGWGGAVTTLLSITAANWTITSPDNGVALYDSVPTIAAALDINGHYPTGADPSFAETLIYLHPGGVNNLVLNDPLQEVEQPVSVLNVTGAPPFRVGTAILLVGDYWQPTVGSERVSVWKSTDGGNTFTVQDDAHAPTRLPNSVAFLSGSSTPSGHAVVPSNFAPFAGGYVSAVVLPDPKICKRQQDVRPQFQTRFHLRGLPDYKKRGCN